MTVTVTPSAMTGKAIVESPFDRAANLVNLEDYMRRMLISMRH